MEVFLGRVFIRWNRVTFMLRRLAVREKGRFRLQRSFLVVEITYFYVKVIIPVLTISRIST